MLQHAASIQQAINGLGAIVENQTPLVRFLVRNWPISILAGAALGGRVWSLHKKKELTSFKMLETAGVILTPMVALFTIQQMAEMNAQKRQDTAVVPGVQPLPPPLMMSQQ